MTKEICCDRRRAGLSCSEDTPPRLKDSARDGDYGVYLSSERYRGGYRYRVEVRNYAHPDAPKGGRSRSTSRCPTEARRLYDDALTAVRAKRGLTMALLVDTYLQTVDVKPVTLTNYRQTLEAFCDLRQCVVDVRREHVAQWAARFQTTGRKGKRSVATAKIALSYVRTMFEHAIDQGLVQNNPAARVKIKGRPSKGKAQLREDEARAFLNEAYRRIDAYGDSFRSRQRAIGALGAMLAIGCALRNGEVRGLTRRDVQSQGAVLYVATTGGKTKNATRIVELAPPFAERLWQHAQRFDSPDDKLFGYGHDWLIGNCERICAAVAVPRVVPHGMRGTHATLARKKGQTSHAIADQLGHGDIAITEGGAYIKPESRDQAIADRVAEVLH